MTDYIFDIDGTLANVTHRRHFVQTKPKNWDAFDKAMVYDEPVPEIVELCKTLYAEKEPLNYEKMHRVNRIILCSGRKNSFRKQTLGWLNSNYVPFDALYMRAADDFRDDTLVKKELLDKIRADGYNPTVVFDDRTKVVNMWRDNGLVCLQVAPGDF